MTDYTDHDPDTCVGICCGTCARCGQQFDPTDTSFDGRARHALGDYCRSCVNRCHESTDFAHACPVCDTDRR
ncbi:hypothetical protein BX265_4966 [Streptomyces sp. TLI_235]|nr:hypothetical protein [Streptomyces sp. TLI_235]PBC80130.1 hypothetical protein BX265_4966 [Streptomyces sp. TLI_235]